MKIKVERRIHDMWRAYKIYPMIKKLGLKNIFGKYQYIYSSKKATISLIQMGSPIDKDKWRWEICGGGIIEGRRFPTKTKADKFIRSLLS